MNTQLKKGILELCVLCTLDFKDCYGFELVGKISHSIEISEGTIYPLLKRLRDDGYVTTYLVETNEGPVRKYYRLTSEGKLKKAMLVNEWQYLTKGVNEIMDGVNVHE